MGCSQAIQLLSFSTITIAEATTTIRTSPSNQYIHRLDHFTEVRFIYVFKVFFVFNLLQARVFVVVVIIIVIL